MIPKFPEFKKIELSDRFEIEQITHRFPPYSDFNFMSMWVWDTHNEMEISVLNDNLVVKFADYLTGSYFFSFIGDNAVTETAVELLEFSKEKNFNLILKLIPEVVANSIDTNILNVEEDMDHFDYILSLELISTYPGHNMRGHASFLRRFVEFCGDDLKIELLDLNNKDIKKSVLDLTKTWIENKNNDNKEFAPSLESAVEKYFSKSEQDSNIVSIGLFYKNNLVAFTINEVESGDYCVCHFMKADNSYKGIYSCLVSETAKELLKRGKKYINFEQDLGLKNLRQSKKTYQPVEFLKKFKVSPIT